jgi:hypothetical protein
MNGLTTAAKRRNAVVLINAQINAKNIEITETPRDTDPSDCEFRKTVMANVVYGARRAATDSVFISGKGDCGKGRGIFLAGRRIMPLKAA